MTSRRTRPRIVAIGGGTGLSTLLRAVKALPLERIVAIVTVSDDGGSSGRLRREFGVLPPGDVRNCLVALAEDDELLTRLFDLRFPGEGPVGGHSFGNLFMTALQQLTGDFPRAVRLAAEVLRVRGSVLPATRDGVQLLAEGVRGDRLVGESAIASGGPPRRLSLLPPDPQPLPEALVAVETADLVVLGPGSLYTSLLPNLLVPDLRAAIAAAACPKVYVANLVTQPGETDGFDLAKHVSVLAEYAPEVVFDVVLVHDEPLPAAAAAAYRESGAVPVLPPREWNGAGQVHARPLLEVAEDGKLRHARSRLRAALGELVGLTQ